MKKKTMKALETSIRHWEQMVEHPTQNSGMPDCALCRRFCLSKEAYACSRYDTYEERDEVCPVRQKTGRVYCLGAPYRVWHKQRTKKAAQAMVDFLKALRP